MDFTYLKEIWRGEEKLSVVFWLFYVVGGLGVALLLSLFMFLGESVAWWLNYLAILLIAVPYSVFIYVSLWRSAFNVENKMFGHGVRALLLYLLLATMYDFLV